MRAFYAWHAFDTEHGWSREAEGDLVTLHGPAVAPGAPFAEAVPSWSAHTPAGTWIEVQARARQGEQWTGFYQIARWDSLAESSRRTSFGPQRDAAGHVATDTLVLHAPAERIQLQVRLHTSGASAPALHSLAVTLSDDATSTAAGARLPIRELAVPPRAQLDYPDGPNICSPTSIAMLLAYWHARTGDARLTPFAEPRAVADIACPLVYDPAYEGHGNWAFNTALAASYGLRAHVARLAGLADLGAWIAAGVPVAISVAWQPGQLDNAPIEASRGHLLIASGFSPAGDVIVADPRGGTPAEVRRVYRANQLERAWQHSHGLAYLVYPPGWPVPTLA